MIEVVLNDRLGKKGPR
ncbi:hypothetical protein Patl1_06091 [Pistacia atlantica]|uniref:Uncharacterized protein n=1 Tax=Pistacia atlantica TaxID=434234 RepID=A0ACC1BRJ7_9ROSI|nr:hypothetical protein Patl1_06091 [Pistacia atlantica]